MSKKSRRARKSPSRSVPQVAVQVETPAAVTDPVADRQEYAYVGSDLSRVAILAGAMFALLIALSFFIG
jgi:hypothetical protein